MAGHVRSVMFKFGFVLVVMLVAAAASQLYDTYQLAQRDVQREVGLRVGPAMDVVEEWYRETLLAKKNGFRAQSMDDRLKELATGRVLRVMVMDAAGVVRASSDPGLVGHAWPVSTLGEGLPLRKGAADRLQHRFATTSAGNTLLVAIRPIANKPSLYPVFPSVQDSVGAVAVEAEGDDILRQVFAYWRVRIRETALLFAGVLALLVLAYLGWVRRPFLILVRNVERAAADRRVRIPLTGNDEFGRIATQFNSFADAVEEHLDKIGDQARELERQAELQRGRVERLSRTRTAMHQLASTLDVNLLRSVAVRVAPQVVPCKRCALVFVDEAFGCVTLSVYDAETEEHAQDNEITRPLPGSRVELESSSFWPSWRDDVLRDREAQVLESSITVLQRWSGLVMLMRPHTAAAFSEEEQALFHLFVEDLNSALQNARLYDMAIRDGLTSLFTRRYFETRLEQETERAGRFGVPLSLLVMDLNEFKAVNDLMGHAAGDQVLRAVGQALGATTRTSDLACRFGGDEFAVLLVHTPRDQAELAAHRIVKDISQHAGLPELPDGRRVTVAVGISSFPDDGRTKEEMIASADRAMYAHKHSLDTGELEHFGA